MTLDADYLLQKLDPYPVRCWWVGFSGGLDSCVLLHLAVEAGLATRGALRAIHIHHALHPYADHWAGHCQALCERLGVPLSIVHVRVPAGASLEACARQARYEAFEHQLGEGDGLLLAHHQDDQAETLLLRLLRGSGPRGLVGIPARRSLGGGCLVRPLLARTRAELEAYARKRQLSWLEDPSNDAVEHDRNYLRHRVLPVLKQRWPEVSELFARSARYCQEAETLNRELAALDYRDCADNGALNCPSLLGLSRLRQKNLLRHWLHRGAAPVPSEPLLLRIIDEVAAAREDGEPCVRWGGVAVRRYRQRLYLSALQTQLPEAPRPWDLQSVLRFDFGCLRAGSVGDGVLAIRPVDPRRHRIEVRFRQGGERIRLPGRSGSRSLKKLLQERGVPPWERPLLPLIYIDDQLAAVADLWVAEGFQSLDSGDGIGICWEPFFSGKVD